MENVNHNTLFQRHLSENLNFPDVFLTVRKNCSLEVILPKHTKLIPVQGPEKTFSSMKFLD